MESFFFFFFEKAAVVGHLIISKFSSLYKLCLLCNILFLTDLEEPIIGSEQSSTTVENYLKFSVWVSFFEIYNECFYDLLVPISNDKKRKTLRLAQDVKGCPYVKGD